jgi:hypothetical protein
MPHASPVSSSDSTLNGSDEGIVNWLYIINAITSEKAPTNRTLKPLSLKACQFFSSMSDLLLITSSAIAN